MKKLLIATLIIASIPLTVLAEDISVEDLLGNNDGEISQNIDELEQERTENIENELNISIPDYTDNPSHIITFTDPSEDKEGVELDIDESGYKDINSPYSLPSLSIGKHRLKFRFVDSIGATKVLAYDLIIIPRPPSLKAPKFEENNLILSGTGLANSEVLITVSVLASNYTQIADINLDGNWNTSIELDTPPKGIYTVFGYTRKNGYASNPSEPAVMEYGSDGSTTTTKDTNIYFNLSEIELDNIPSIIAQNPDLLILAVSGLLLGGLVSSLLFILFRRSRTKDVEKDVKEKMNGKPKEERTLMELFGAEEKEEKKDGKIKKEKKESKKKKETKKEEKKKDTEAEIKEEEEKERKQKERIFTRRDFLKDFKKFDPDKDSGEENKEPSKKDKKDVIVTLTSKVEE